MNSNNTSIPSSAIDEISTCAISGAVGTFANINPNVEVKLNENFDSSEVDTVFLALPHGASHKYVKSFYNKIC